MLEKPDLSDERVMECLQTVYGLAARELRFLPLGADPNTAVYRAQTGDAAYFLKLRRGDFHPATVTVPNELSRLGVRPVIAAIAARDGAPWGRVGDFHTILYPYVDGLNGFERGLSAAQWVEFGEALKRFHTASFPAHLTAGLPREAFSPRWRDSVTRFLGWIETRPWRDPASAETAGFLTSVKAETLALVSRAGELARALAGAPPAFTLCHGDIHAWNLLVRDERTFYMVDWDTLLFAPKERDLMFIGCGLGGNARPPEEEVDLFYRGYGPAEVNPAALAYYRYERIVEDIAVYCEQIFLSEDGGDDRAQAVIYLKSNYLPGGVLEMARRLDGGNR